jgi:hypothetical protein
LVRGTEGAPHLTELVYRPTPLDRYPAEPAVGIHRVRVRHGLEQRKIVDRIAVRGAGGEVQARRSRQRPDRVGLGPTVQDVTVEPSRPRVVEIEERRVRHSPGPPLGREALFTIEADRPASERGRLSFVSA